MEAVIFSAIAWIAFLLIALHANAPDDCIGRLLDARRASRAEGTPTPAPGAGEQEEGT